MKQINNQLLAAIQALLLCLALASLTACTASGRTSIDTYSTDASADFSQMKSYRWDYAVMGKSMPEGSHNPEFDRVVADHVDQSLADKGYTRTPKGPVDFTLDYRITVKAEEAAEQQATTPPDSQSLANDYGLRWTFDKGEAPQFKGLQPPKSQTVIYRQGTLHIAAFNQQGQMIWHSSATRIINEQSNEASRRAAIRVAIDKIMRTFPDQ